MVSSVPQLAYDNKQYNVVNYPRVHYNNLIKMFYTLNKINKNYKASLLLR